MSPATAGSVRWSVRWMRKTHFIAWPHHPSVKVVKARTLFCWHQGGSRVIPGVAPHCIINALLISFHILFSSLPAACSFIKPHDAFFFCPSQGPISDCSAFCHFAHPPLHWRLYQRRGALCWLHNSGGVQHCHQGWPNEEGAQFTKHTS